MSPPLLDGAALKDATVRDYRRWAERAGVPVDMAAIERQATIDCEIGGRVLADRTPAPPAAPDPERAAAKAGELERQVAATGATLVSGNANVTRRRSVLAAKAIPQTRWSFAMGRLARILEGAPHNPEPGTLAHDILRLKAWATMRIPKRAAHLLPTRRAKDEQNPFDGRTERDFHRMFVRMVEDICDRSTGTFGPWWVK